MTSDQNPIIRRAYIIRPRQELIDELTAAGGSDLVERCEAPNVVMAEALPYEGS